MYKLIEGQYQQQIGEPYGMPEVGLGIGRSQQRIGGIEQEVLSWFDEQANAYPTPETVAQQLRQQLQTERQRTETEQRRAEQLAQYLQSLGLDPDHLPEP